MESFKVLKRETLKLFGVFRHPTFLYLTIVGNGFLVLAATAVYYLEKEPGAQIKTYFDALWWGISTITTVAYGDILPQTFWGRIIGIVLMYTGTVLFISFTGVLLTLLLREEVEAEMIPLKRDIREEGREQARIEKTLQEILRRLDQLEKKGGIDVEK